MTPRPWSTRLLRACLALWLALAGGERGMMHGCAQHDGATSHGHAAHERSSAGSQVMTHGAHGTHVAARGTDETPAAPHACTCVGACAAAPGSVALVPPHTLPVAATVRATVAELPADLRQAPAGRLAHVLPFGNGPPAAALTA